MDICAFSQTKLQPVWLQHPVSILKHNWVDCMREANQYRVNCYNYSLWGWVCALWPWKTRSTFKVWISPWWCHGQSLKGLNLIIMMMNQRAAATHKLQTSHVASNQRRRSHTGSTVLIIKCPFCHSWNHALQFEQTWTVCRPSCLFLSVSSADRLTWLCFSPPQPLALLLCTPKFGVLSWTPVHRLGAV